MRQLLYDVLATHLLWLETGGTFGQQADLRGANLRGADLRGADLDFSSGIPFHCGGTKIKGDYRLFSQMVYHLFNQEWPDECREVLSEIKKTGAHEWFKQYRSDI